jgi:hypothetical protein
LFAVQDDRESNDLHLLTGIQRQGELVTPVDPAQVSPLVMVRKTKSIFG